MPVNTVRTSAHVESQYGPHGGFSDATVYSAELWRWAPWCGKDRKRDARKSLSFKTRVPDVLSKRAFMRGERECKSFAFVCPTEMHSAKGIAFCAMFAGVDDKAGKTKNRAKITGPKRGRI